MGRISLNPMDRKLVILSAVVLSAQGAIRVKYYTMLSMAEEFRGVDKCVILLN